MQYRYQLELWALRAKYKPSIMIIYRLWATKSTIMEIVFELFSRQGFYVPCHGQTCTITLIDNNRRSLRTYKNVQYR